MNLDGKRVSSASLAQSVSDAIALEKNRIEQLDADMIDHVSGGTATGPTAGYFPTDDTPH